MPRRVLLVGLRGVVVDEAQTQLNLPDLDVVGCTSVVEVRAALDAGPVDTVIIGGGLDLPVRLEMVREVLSRSDTATVHLKDHASGSAGFLPFAKSVLS